MTRIKAWQPGEGETGAWISCRLDCRRLTGQVGSHHPSRLTPPDSDLGQATPLPRPTPLAETQEELLCSWGWKRGGSQLLPSKQGIPCQSLGCSLPQNKPASSETCKSAQVQDVKQKRPWCGQWGHRLRTLHLPLPG